VMSVTRRYRFSASHRLHSAALSKEQNASLYGKCNNPYGHGHDYVLEVTCTGEPDPISGVIIPIGALDRLIEARVLRVFASRNINQDVAEFATLVPTTENIVIVIGRILGQHWMELLKPAVKLARVHVQETDRNGFEVVLPQMPEMRTQSEAEKTVYA
jgi:6-pyruvoyltetrahydropterin/6-carboxytetrahydropterin synthase